MALTDKKIEQGINRIPNIESSLEESIAFNKEQFSKNTNYLSTKTFVKYGEIDLSIFEGLQHNVNFKLWRDNKDGKIKHNFKIDETGYEIRYIKKNGSMSSDGKTESTAWSNLKECIIKLENDTTISKAKIIIKGIMARDRNFMDLTQLITKKYIITSDTPQGSNQFIDTYTVYNGTTMIAPCPYSVMGVARIDETDIKGNPSSYKKVTTLDDCLIAPNTFYSDGVNLYINRLDTTSQNTMVLISSACYQFKLDTNAEIILDNLIVLSGTSSNPVYFEGNGKTCGKVILNKVRVKNYGGGITANGISTNGIKDTKLFDCVVYDIIRDGFNYHNTKEIGGKGTVFEYNCYGENTGLDTSTANNNISTAHEGIHVIRVNTIGNKSRGPLIADVNGCYSLCIDVSVSNTSLTSSAYQNSAFCFTDDVAEYNPNPNGKAWLVNCCGGTSTEWGINGDASFKNGKIFIDNFNGMNLPSDLKYKLLY